MSNRRFCKKCGVELSEKNTHSLCANCRSEKAEKIRKVGIFCSGIFATIVFGLCKRIGNDLEQNEDEFTDDQDA